MKPRCDRWRVMVLTLRGLALPPLPALAGRRHVCAAAAADAEDRDDILHSRLGAREAARLLGLSMREVQRLRAQIHETGETTP